MVKQEAFRKVGSERSRSWAILFSVVLVSLVCIAGGLNSLWHHWCDGPRPYRAACAVVLLALGAWQLFMARSLLKPRNVTSKALLLTIETSIAWMFVGLVTCYAFTLWLGPNPAVRYFFRATLAAWFTMGLLAHTGQPTVKRLRQAWCRRRVTRATGWAVLAVTVLFSLIEFMLRTGEGHHLSFAKNSYTIGVSPSADLTDEALDRAIYAGPFRIAALGHDDGLADEAANRCLHAVQQHVPGMELFSFVHPRSRLQDYAAQMARDVVPYDPDLVLVFISVGEDLVPQAPPPGRYDWRSLRLAQLTSSWWQTPPTAEEHRASSQPPANYESYLRDAAPQMVVCRTPIDPAMKRHWQQTLKHLDALVEACRSRQMSLGVVVVPSEFQVNASLCQSLSRRVGYSSEQIDLELPQRRLAKFAQERNLVLVDLLPYFRAADTSPFSRHSASLSQAGQEIVTDVVSGWLESRFSPTFAATAQASVTK